MANKYFAWINNALTQIEALVTSSGAGDAGKIPALDASGRLDTSLLPTGIGADTQVVTTSENLSAGNLVNLYSNGGVFTARKADGTTAGKEADGYVLASTTGGQNTTIYGIGTNSAVTGLTPGRVYLSTTAGGITQTPPSSAGNVVQDVGFATASGELWFQRGTPIIL